MWFKYSYSDGTQKNYINEVQNVKEMLINLGRKFSAPTSVTRATEIHLFVFIL